MVYVIEVLLTEEVSQFTYLGCSISYQFSYDVEFKLAKFLQLIGTIKRTKTKLNSVALVRTRTIPTEQPPPVGEVSANFCG